MPAGLSEIGAFVRRHDPDRFFCALFAPPEQREALFALIALHHELGRVRAAASHPLAAAIRLQWWRDAIAASTPPRHEVATPLHAAIRAGLLDREALLAMVDAREVELAEEGIATRTEFTAYLRRTHGALAVAAGRLLGAAAQELAALEAIGTLQGLAGLLRAAPLWAARGRCLLPRDALAEAGLDPQAALAEPERLTPVIRALAREAAPPLPRPWPPRLLAAALPAVFARRDVRRLAAGRAAQRGTADRLAVLWAALRRCA
ncbi:MAG: squalene/phytoene synthase family protein [Rhodovarius sp.]|nr:squalene/phytoene synthase family protein [Rhodovarius sp.]